MSVALQIRDVPEEDRDTIARMAAAKGQSMQAFLLDMVSEKAQQARNAEAFDRLAPHRIDIPPELDVVAIIREGRDAGFEVDREAY